MVKGSRKKSLSPIKIPKATAGDHPATRRMLHIVRDELRGEIKLVRSELIHTRDQLRGEIHHVRDELRGEIKLLRDELQGEMKLLRSELKEDIHRLSAEIGEIKVMVHRSNLLVEEQNANNRIVLEGLQTLWQRQERLEAWHYR